MKQPGCVIWGLTKFHNAQKRQHKGMKARHDCFTAHPLSISGRFNASDSGVQDGAVSVSRAVVKGSSKKFKQTGLRPAYKLHHATKGHHGVRSQTVFKTAAVAKAVKGLDRHSCAKKAALLRKVRAIHATWKATSTA